MIQPEVNFLAVLVAAIVNMVIGSLWYSPVMFGTLWMKLVSVKKDKEAMKKGMPRALLGGFIVALVMAYVLAHFVDYTEATTFGLGMLTGFWIWLGFAATLGAYSFIYEGKPFKLYAINAGFSFVCLVIMGGILGAWN